MLAVHLTVAVGWIGSVITFLVVVVVAMRSDDGDLRSAWTALDWMADFAIVPLALLAFVSGIVLAVGTPWGLFRHYWVTISLALTTVAVAVLLSNVQTVDHYAALARRGELGSLRDGLRTELVHAGAGLCVLLVVQVLNLYKPRGLTRYGLRKQAATASVS